MGLALRQLVTIVAESVVEQKLVDDIKKVGAKGYSLGHVKGEGVTGNRSLELTGQSIRIETVVTDRVAEAIMELLARDYFDKYAVVAWVTPAQVMRPSHFE